jgi:hypothetical protein
LVENVARIWRDTAHKRGSQLIFSDMGINPTPWGFSAYEEITRKLVERGIPREQIASAGDADTDAKKQALFEKVRQGAVRVLLGSTAKMGTGTNVQKRLVALHHLDAPWKPAEIEQREGRILRQGNENEQVSIYRYVTEGSFDAYMWQALEIKARFISQVMSGDNALRSAQDIASDALSYAEVKAIASGNPAVLTLAEADAELQRLAVLKKNHADEQYLARRALRDLPATIERLQQRLNGLTADQATMAAHADDRITIGSTPYGREHALEALGQRLDSLPAAVRQPLGVYKGVKFGVLLHPEFAPSVFLEGQATRQDNLSRQSHGPRAVMNAVERLAAGYNPECARLQQDLAIATAQLRDYRDRQGTPFPYDDYQSRLTTLRDQLRAGLSATQPQEGQPSVASLAESIKALKASAAIEAAPERTGKRRPAGEQPVTSRVRRPKNGTPAATPAATVAEPAECGSHVMNDYHQNSESDASPPPPSVDQSGIGTVTPQTTHQDRLANRSPRKQWQRSLF